jgi:uncharacterized protein
MSLIAPILERSMGKIRFEVDDVKPAIDRLLTVGEFYIKQRLPQVVKKFLLVLLLCLTIMSFPLPVLALTIQDVPNPRQTTGEWIADMANLLGSGDELLLNQAISDLEADTGIEVAVVTVLSTTPYPSPEYFAKDLFNYWGIGKENLNNGVLLLVSKGDRRVEIRAGKGIVHLLPDEKIQSLINIDILPQFRSGNFATGVLEGTKAIIQTVRTIQPKISSESVHNYEQVIYPFIIILLIVVIIGLLIFIALRPTEVDPESRAFRGGKRQKKVPICNRCHLPMQTISTQDLLIQLTPAQGKAQEIGGITFQGWRCPPECQQENSPSGIHLQEYILNDKEFKNCPVCQEWTMRISKEILRPATMLKEGKRLIRQECCFCSLVEEQEETISPGQPIYNADGIYIDSVSSLGSSNDTNSFGGGTGEGGGGGGGGW